MKTVFKLLAVLALGAVLTLPARAQFFGGLAGSSALTVLNGGTNRLDTIATNFVTAATNAFAPLIRIPNGRQLLLSVTAGDFDSTNSTVTTYWSRSLDGVSFPEPAAWTLALSATAGSTATIMTNIDVGAAQYVCLLAVTNLGRLTNFSVSYALKPGY